GRSGACVSFLVRLTRRGIAAPIRGEVTLPATRRGESGRRIAAQSITHAQPIAHMLITTGNGASRIGTRHSVERDGFDFCAGVHFEHAAVDDLLIETHAVFAGDEFELRSLSDEFRRFLAIEFSAYHLPDSVEVVSVFGRQGAVCAYLIG